VLVTEEMVEPLQITFDLAFSAAIGFRIISITIFIQKQKKSREVFDRIPRVLYISWIRGIHFILFFSSLH
jgi:hypothetical protein